nr:cytochrome P450 [Kibdelosporangium sp. MJ126-NF4]CEL23501.1 putative secreted protein [Kibdelosporangium sp. MJ126-NF4]CTQ89115.1 putative secreted protein [Kibdelosporangium sp. MJ126-NF4]
MNPIVAQILTFVGVLLGAAATFLVTTVTERTRWRRAQVARWDEKRLQAYTEYANTVKQMVRLCRRVAETKKLLPTGEPVDIDDAFTALSEAETDRALKWETVLLLGDPATVVAARAWHEQVWQLESILRNDETSFVDAYKKAMLLRNEFYAQARADLNVSGGALSELTWSSLQLKPRDQNQG